MKMETVLFLCTGNSARSQMAEGLLRAKGAGRFEAVSAGTEPAAVVNPLAIEAMRETGIDISAQRPKPMTDLIGRLEVDHVIIVCDGANRACPSGFPGARSRSFWPIEDPAALGLPEFRRARDEIAARIDAWLGRIELD